MFGLGTIINTASVILGGLCGLLFGKLLKERHQESLKMACGVSVLFIGIAGAMEGMLSIEEGAITSGKSMIITLCLVVGMIIGEIINFDGLFERFGTYLKIKTKSENDNTFIEGFVTTSLTVCVGAMAIVGAIEDGLTGDWTVLGIKSILDFVMVMIMTCSLGKGCIFSAIPIFIFQGLFTVLARLISPILTDSAMAYLSMVGSVLIFCVGINIVWGKKVRVANLLPAIILAVAFSFVPFNF